MHAALCVLRIYPGLRVGLRGVLLALGASAARYRQEIRGARTENALGDVEDRQLGVDAFLHAEYGCGTANHVPERVACGTTLTPPPLDWQNCLWFAAATHAQLVRPCVPVELYAG